MPCRALPRLVAGEITLMPRLQVKCSEVTESGQQARWMKRIYQPFRSSSRQLGPLEQRMLDTLWVKGSGTVRELLDDGYQDLAYTTVMTTLDRLFKKDVLTRTEEGRAFRYAPRFSREEMHREAAGQAFRQLLDASPVSSLPLSFLVDILGDRDARLLDDLWKLVEDRRRELSQAKPGEATRRESGRKETD